MRVLVAVKRCVDYAAKVRVLPDRTGVDLSSVKMSMNPFCEIALEEAVRMKERGEAAEVVAATVGPAASAETLRHALALGADRAVHVTTGGGGGGGAAGGMRPLAVAKALAAVCARESPGAVLMGKQAIDGDHNQTGQALAALMGWPQATFASRVEGVADGAATVAREVDAGEETVRVSLPAVVTADLRLNEPRYATLPNIMKAKKKPIEALPLAELCPAALEPPSGGALRRVRVEPPPARAPGRMVGSVDELIQGLKEAKVI